MSAFQHLQQSDPTNYQQATQQIATNLQSVAQTAQTSGNSTAANQLNQLAADFTSASESGQLPNVQDVAQAIGSHHRHHHHAHRASADSNGNSSSSNASQALSHLLSSFQANSAQSDLLNPMSIITSTLSGAGISGSN
jgi:hypothetical protein